jgi:hypothetical protein
LENATNENLRLTSYFIASLYQVYRSNNEQLLVAYTSDEINKAILATRSAICSVFSPISQKRLLRKEELKSEQDFIDFLLILFGQEGEAVPKSNELQMCLVVFSYLVCASHHKRIGALAFAGSCTLFPENPLFLIQFAFARSICEIKDAEGIDEIVTEVQYLAERAKYLSPEGSPIYRLACYLWAAMELRRPIHSVAWPIVTDRLEQCTKWMEECDVLLPCSYFYLVWASLMKHYHDSDMCDLAARPIPSDVRKYYVLGLQAQRKTLPLSATPSEFPLQQYLSGLITKQFINVGEDPCVMEREERRVEKELFYEHLKILLATWESTNSDPLKVSHFQAYYEKLFGKSVPLSEEETMLSMLKKAVAKGYCCLEQTRDESSWAVRPTQLDSFFRNLEVLLRGQETRSINTAQLQPIYRAKFGQAIPVPVGQKLIDLLKHAEIRGHCLLEQKRGGKWNVLSKRERLN